MTDTDGTGSSVFGDRPTQIRRFRQFVMLDMPANVAGIVLLFAVWIYLPFPWVEVLTLTVLANLVVLMVAYHQAGQGRLERGVWMVSVALWVITMEVAFIVPPLMPITVLLVIWPAVLGLPYLGRESIRTWLAVTTVVSACVGLMVWRGDAKGVAEALPGWVVPTAMSLLIPIFTALLCQLILQYSTRLLDTLEQVQGANVALRRSEALLEQKVASRTQELAESRDEALKATRAKSAFLANMSHELRTPLNAIIGYSELLSEELADDDKDDLVGDVDKIHGAGKHLLELINGILDLSKIEAGRMELHVEAFDVPAMVAETEGILQPLMDKNGNTFVVELEEAVGEMQADAMKVRQSLLNLLSNAAKFTEAGRVSLRVTRHDGGVPMLHFEVEDTGIGMTPEQIDRLFEPFRQADVSTTKRFGGTGLGLTISRHFCEMMGGDISVRSTAGQGTVFRMEVPEQVTIEATTAEESGPGPVALRPDDIEAHTGARG